MDNLKRLKDFIENVDISNETDIVKIEKVATLTKTISEIEKIMNRRHEQKCCVMTNFDGIRCQVSPSGISYPHSKIHVLASAEPPDFKDWDLAPVLFWPGPGAAEE